MFAFALFAQDLLSNVLSFNKPLYMSIADNHARSKKPLVHHAKTSTIVHIFDALRTTKCRRTSTSDLNGIFFDNIVIEDAKYLPSMFDYVVGVIAIPYPTLGFIITKVSKVERTYLMSIVSNPQYICPNFTKMLSKTVGN